jgi:hypothetical protein
LKPVSNFKEDRAVGLLTMQYRNDVRAALVEQRALLNGVALPWWLALGAQPVDGFSKLLEVLALVSEGVP